MADLLSEVRRRLQQSETPLLGPLSQVMTAPTQLSSAGFPYLTAESFALFRDHVPHILGNSPHVWAAVLEIEKACRDILQMPEDAETIESVERAKRVIRTILNTACVTAPPDLWIARQLLSSYKELGLIDRFLGGESIDTREAEFRVDGQTLKADARELQIDLEFLVARGFLDMKETRFWCSELPWAQDTLRQVSAECPDHAVHTIDAWATLLQGEQLAHDAHAALLGLTKQRFPTPPQRRPTWVATWNEIELAYRLLPLMLALDLTGESRRLLSGETFCPAQKDDGVAEILEGARDILVDSGVLKPKEWTLTETGKRVCTRASGPYGIIATYRAYLEKCRDIVLSGRGQVWVERGANVAASQDANRRTFEKANDSLDRFCEDTGFQYRVFIEHAVGRGEATGQRWRRSGEKELRYFGADLEDAAIDAAMAAQRDGRLPSNMAFIRRADIGNADYLIEKLAEHKASSHGAVMLVGNGFHEVRNQTDDIMIAMFRAYAKAGLILLFTEENALSVDDLRATAWNTYHTGFKYVHEKSGQGLRPAYPRKSPQMGRPLPASWNECASKAGYVRLESYCSRTRTIYPYAIKGRRNPSISVNHFFIPQALAESLGLAQDGSP